MTVFFVPYPRSRNFGLHPLCGILFLCTLLLAGTRASFAQEKPSAIDLLRLAKSGSPALEQSLRPTFNANELRDGTASKGHLSSFLFVIETPSRPTLIVCGTAFLAGFVSARVS